MTSLPDLQLCKTAHTGWIPCGGLGEFGMLGALDFFWSQLALEQASSPAA